MTKAEELFENMFKKRLFLSTKHKDWIFRNINQFSKDERKKDILAFVQAKLDEGCEVLVGWDTTSVRGFHEYFVAWKTKACPKTQTATDIAPTGIALYADCNKQKQIVR